MGCNFLCGGHALSATIFNLSAMAFNECLPSEMGLVGHFQGSRNWMVLKLLRRFLINSSDGALTYTEELRRMLLDLGCRSEKVVSANNSDVKKQEVIALPLPSMENGLNVLFVGRHLKQKRVERLIDLAGRVSYIRVRLIGPGMESLKTVIKKRGLANRVSFFGPKTDEDLKEDFFWCHLVANPGSLGLLVLSTSSANV